MSPRIRAGVIPIAVRGQMEGCDTAKALKEQRLCRTAAKRNRRDRFLSVSLGRRRPQRTGLWAKKWLRRSHEEDEQSIGNPELAVLCPGVREWEVWGAVIALEIKKPSSL